MKSQLDHNARKLLQILFYLYKSDTHKIDLARLMFIAGKSSKVIMPAIEQLQEQGYIIWDKYNETVKVLKVDIPVIRCSNTLKQIAR